MVRNRAKKVQFDRQLAKVMPDIFLAAVDNFADARASLARDRAKIKAETELQGHSDLLYKFYSSNLPVAGFCNLHKIHFVVLYRILKRYGLPTRKQMRNSLSVAKIDKLGRIDHKEIEYEMQPESEWPKDEDTEEIVSIEPIKKKTLQPRKKSSPKQIDDYDDDNASYGPSLEDDYNEYW